MKTICTFLLSCIIAISASAQITDTVLTDLDWLYFGTGDGQKTWVYDWTSDTIDATGDDDTIVIIIPNIAAPAMVAVASIRQDSIPDTTALAGTLYIRTSPCDLSGETDGVITETSEECATVSSQELTLPADQTWITDIFSVHVPYINIVFIATAGQGVLHLDLTLKPSSVSD